MPTLEMVEKLRTYANISYEDAKSALEQCGDDLLEAVVYLEKQGKIPTPQNGGSYSTKAQTGELVPVPQPRESKDERRARHDAAWKGFWGGVSDVFTKSLKNQFEVVRGGEVLFALPVLFVLILLLCCFWIVVPLLIVGLFFGCRYRFSGADLEKTGANRVMDSAAEAAESIKKEVRDIASEHEKNDHHPE